MEIMNPSFSMIFWTMNEVKKDENKLEDGLELY